MVLAAIGLGLTALQMVGGARKGAKQSRSNISAWQSQIGDINKSLGELESQASLQTDVAKTDLTKNLTTQAEKLGRTKTDALENIEESSTEFAFSGETEEKLTDVTEHIDLNFEDTKKVAEQELDKTLASIEEWKGSETKRLEAERKTLFHQIGAARNTDTFMENLFG